MSDMQSSETTPITPPSLSGGGTSSGMKFISPPAGDVGKHFARHDKGWFGDHDGGKFPTGPSPLSGTTTGPHDWTPPSPPSTGDSSSTTGAAVGGKWMDDHSNASTTGTFHHQS